ncbi:MAG: nucleotidyltransferase domain-containing protein [Candidatus Aenigmatarchaeota archaeon]
MKTEIKIIKFLLAGRKRCTIRELSKGIRADYKITHTAVQSLIKKGVLVGMRVGQSVQVSLTLRLTKDTYEAEDERRKDLMKNRNIHTMDFWLSELKFPFIALVFGSHAKGAAAKHSDIDLMVICDENRKKHVENKMSNMTDVHLTVLTPDGFLEGMRSKDPTVQAEALQNHIILVNIEQYYGMISNAG